MKKKTTTAVLFVLPFILFFMMFWLIPFVYGIVMSVSKYSLVKGNQGFVDRKSTRLNSSHIH